MRTGLTFLQALVGLTSIAALAACGDDGGGTGGGGQGGSGSTADSTANVGPGPGATGSTGGSPVAQSSSTGAPACGASVSTDPACDACGATNCCSEVEECYLNGGDCFDETGVLSEDRPGGAALIECLGDNCQADCFGGDFLLLCTSDIGWERPVDPETEEFANCFNDSCCDAFAECEASSDCLDCMLGNIVGPDGLPDFSLCDAAHACSLSQCDSGLVFYPYCDSGIGSSGSIPVSACLAGNCCAAFNACTGGPYDFDSMSEDEEEAATAAIQECLDCLIDGGGTLCDAAIACEEENCNTAICDSGVVINNPEVAGCVADACCQEYNDCTGGPYTDDDFDDPATLAAIEACIDCFNAFDPESGTPAGALCADAIACDEANCSGEGGGGGGGAGGEGGGN